MNLNILYRDQWLIAIDKPAGVLVHSGDDPNTQAEIAMKVLRDQIGAKVWPVHRLDCPTSGVLLFSLSNELVIHLRKLFDQGEVQKSYQAVVLGECPEAWACQERLRKSEGEPDRDAETIFVRKSIGVVEGRPVSRVKAIPVTGRYHQIRKHLAISKFPIVGDYRYGDKVVNDRVAEVTSAQGLQLHAYQLAFCHPINSEDIVIDGPLPDRFLGV